MKSKRIITVETWERKIIRQTKTEIIKCELCQAKTVLLTLDEAAYFAEKNSSEILQGIKNGIFHFIKTQNDALLICSNSLQKRFKGENYEKFNERKIY